MAQNSNDFVEKLYVKTYDMLFKVAYRITHDYEHSEDFIHETFLLAVFNQEKLEKHPNPEAWLMITLRNLILNERRLKSRQDIPLEDAADIIAKPLEHSLDELLPAKLNDKERKILIWRFEKQMSYHEMAQQLDCSEALCRKWISQAIQKCRKLLQ